MALTGLSPEVRGRRPAGRRRRRPGPDRMAARWPRSYRGLLWSPEVAHGIQAACITPTSYGGEAGPASGPGTWSSPAARPSR